MSTSDKNSKAHHLLPRIIIHVMDHDPLDIKGLDTSSIVSEINFYSTLNSFAFNADITMIDSGNQILNRMYEPNRVIIEFYQLPKDDKEDTYQLKDRVFRKKFAVSDVKVIKFDTQYPYKSKIKLILSDYLDALIMNKIMNFSNFNIQFTSDEMNPDKTMHQILKEYEKYCGKTIIPLDVFGVKDFNKLKRRFRTDSVTPTRDAFYNYVDKLYDTRWIEFLSNQDAQQFEIPQCFLAYTNKYWIDKDGVFHQRPQLIAADRFDKNPDKPIYSIPYPDEGKILDFAVEQYKIYIEDTELDLCGKTSGKLKEKLLAYWYRQHTFNPFTNSFNDDIKSLDEMRLIAQNNNQTNIETRQNPKYFGLGDDPQFVQMPVFSKKVLIKMPYFIKDNQYYFANGSNSLYKDVSEIILKPQMYAKLRYSAWHSPGQEVDLKLIVQTDQNGLPEKSMLFSMNKLVSGRWKILSSVTTFKMDGGNESDPIGMVPVEILGLGRTKFFYGDDNDIAINRQNISDTSTSNHEPEQPKRYTPTLGNNGFMTMQEI